MSTILEHSTKKRPRSSLRTLSVLSHLTTVVNSQKKLSQRSLPHSTRTDQEPSRRMKWLPSLNNSSDPEQLLGFLEATKRFERRVRPSSTEETRNDIKRK